MFDKYTQDFELFVSRHPYRFILILIFIVLVIYVIMTHEGYEVKKLKRVLTAEDVEDYVVDDWTPVGETETFTGGPIFYNRENFNGKRIQLKSGVFRAPSVGGLGVGNLKSLKVPLGWSVILYTDGNASDGSARPLVPGNYPELGRSHSGKVKAIKVIMSN